MKTYEEGRAILRGRNRIAELAKADGEHQFAREVLAGLWDHRDDVHNAIVEERLKQKGK